MVDQQDGELPGDVSSVSQLDFIPDEYINFLSDRKCINHDVGSPSRGYHRTRPLRHADVSGNVSTYYLDPFASSVFAILVLELLERFSFYGLYMTQTNYLGGSYGDGEWSADLGAMDAASLISLSTAVAYTSPFIGGLSVDGLVATKRVGSLIAFFPVLPRRPAGGQVHGRLQDHTPRDMRLLSSWSLSHRIVHEADVVARHARVQRNGVQGGASLPVADGDWHRQVVRERLRG